MEKPEPEAATLTAASSRDPELGLRTVAALRGLVEALEALQVDNARAKGWSWQDIAGRLGVTKQAVHQKHGPARPVKAWKVTARVRFTEEAGIVPHFAREEAERRHQYYLGPEHLLLGLLVGDENPMVTGLREHGLDLQVGDDNPAARVLGAHGLDLETVRAGIDRLVAAGVLPGPQPSDAELLATLGIDLEAVMARLNESFGWEAYYDAAQDVRLRPAQPFPRAPGAGTPIICWRVFVLVREEATARGEDITPAHWLLALLRDAEDPVEVSAHRYPVERRKRAMFGLPDRGPSPVRLLVESHGLTLEQLRAAVLEELDR